MTPLPTAKLEPEVKPQAAYFILKDKIQTRQARVAVLGLGYVGLPLACAFAKRGYPTTGFEVDPDKVSHLIKGESYIGDIPSERIRDLASSGKLSATTDFSRLHDQDAIIICVPTPLRKSKDPDVSYIVAAVDQIKKHIHAGQLVILESTTYPGTTRELLLPELSRNGLEVGRDFFLAFSPERIDPGNKTFTVENTPKVVGGVTELCRELSGMLYAQAVEKVHEVSSVEAAEMTKLMENTFRSVNIALANEMAMMCNKLGIRVSEVIEAAKTKPFGFMPFYPGPGIGGHCIPLDPHYLAWKMRTLDFEPRFIELAGVINSRMPEFVVEMASDLLNLEAGKALSQCLVLVLGVAYKKDVADMRESPALSILEQLMLRKARVIYHDPHVPLLQLSDKMLRSEPLEPGTLAGADLTLIVTDHAAIDYAKVLEHSRLILDTRNVLKKTRDPKVFGL